MKKIITAFIFCFLCGECFSQAGEWVWIKGDSIPNQPGNFGMQGVPSPTNNPPSLYEPCEWTDLNGNFWLFGGWGFLPYGPYGDLWKYDPLTNEWTWVKGSGSIGNSGNYGVQGVSSPTNNPPARSYGVSSWVDSLGNLWMFGGQSINGIVSDLWKYNISTNEWTWMKGPNIAGQPDIYGTQGVPDPANNPCARWECVARWTDHNNDLWLFGGVGVSNTNVLWRYNIASNQWTWMKGSQISFQPVILGTLGVEDSLNTPGYRNGYSRWKDTNGNFWFFGGFRGTTPMGYNDLWRFNPVSNNWTWMGGYNTTGIYGTKCIASPNNIPGPRLENRACWVDKDGNFWFFGGGNGNNAFSIWNDLWKYCVASKQWIWIRGSMSSNPSGNWGTLGVSSLANRPNGRVGSVGWRDNNNHLYVFGGGSHHFNGVYNDLWKYTIDTTCGVCPAPNSIEENNPSEADELLVFPNPTNSSFAISFQSSSNQNIELHLYNTLGEVQLFQSFKTLEKFFTREINVEKLSNGIYFLQLKTKEGNINRKIIINH